MAEPFQGHRVELAGEDERSRLPLARLAQRRLAVEERNHFLRAVRDRGHDAGGGEEDVEDDDDLARQALAVQLLLLEEDVDLHPRGLCRNMP